MTEANISFQVNGSFSQSARLRQWFPRNLIQPIWKLSGVCPNSFQYQRLGEFIRASQLECITPTSLLAQNFLKLTIYNRGLGDLNMLSQVSSQFRRPHNVNASQWVQGKGPHEHQVVFGYAQNFSRGATKFINAPTYDFEFNVLFAYGGLFATQNASPVASRAFNNQPPNLNNIGNLGWAAQKGQATPPTNMGG